MRDASRSRPVLGAIAGSDRNATLTMGWIRRGERCADATSSRPIVFAATGELEIDHARRSARAIVKPYG